jgi:hypothetical protein
MNGRGEARRPPRAPWGQFPLSELTVLLAIGLAVYGFAGLGSPRAVWAFAGAAALGSLAGLEVAIREHFAGYRPHAPLLAAALAVPALTALVLAGTSLLVAGIAAAALFTGAQLWMTKVFTRRRG